MKVADHIRNLRKAQLQEYFLRWFPAEKMTSDKDTLVHRLEDAMCDPRTIRERYDRLPRSSRDFLIALLTEPERRATVEKVRSSPRGRNIETYEVETLLKTLTNEGWVIPVSETSNGVRKEVFILPDEIADGLAVTIDVECRDPASMISVGRFLEDGSEGETLSGEEIEQRIARLEDTELREAAHAALTRHGGILPLSVWEVEGHESRVHRPEWRHQLEREMIGTTGVLSLRRYGLDLEEECLVIFQEHVESHSRHVLETQNVENDQEYNLGVDLLIDIRRIIEIARHEMLEVTREGSVFKKTEDKIETQLLTSHYRSLFDGTPVHHVLGLCKKLRLLDQGDRYLRPDPMRRKVWAKKKLVAKTKSIFEIYQNEYRGGRWSFHQRLIRKILLKEVVNLPAATWVPAKAVFTLAIARFLSQLDSLDVATTFQELQVEEFQNETLMVPVDRLYQDLSYWFVHRLALAGLVNLGFREGNFVSMQLSSLGRRLFELEPSEDGGGKLVVNPDFEILLFPGGVRYEEMNYTLSAFAERTGSEWVKRYRITPESIKRGVVSGFSAEKILQFLGAGCENRVPSNVEFSIREWAGGIEPVLRQRVVLLRSRSKGGADQLVQLLQEHDVPHERVGDMAISVRGAKNERRIRELRDVFQNAGLILE